MGIIREIFQAIYKVDYIDCICGILWIIKDNYSHLSQSL